MKRREQLLAMMAERPVTIAQAAEAMGISAENRAPSAGLRGYKQARVVGKTGRSEENIWGWRVKVVTIELSHSLAPQRLLISRGRRRMVLRPAARPRIGQQASSADARDLLRRRMVPQAVAIPAVHPAVQNSGVRWLSVPPAGRTLSRHGRLDEGAALFSAFWNAPIAADRGRKPCDDAPDTKARIVNYAGLRSRSAVAGWAGEV